MMGTEMDQYEQGRHDERKRTMQLIGAVRMDMPSGWTTNLVLDKLVMCIVAEPLADGRDLLLHLPVREGEE